MRRHLLAGIVAACMTVASYLVLAWVATGIEIPRDVPTAALPWWWPFRVVATFGFSIASATHVSHLAGDFLCAILLGAALGAVFAATRAALR